MKENIQGQNDSSNKRNRQQWWCTYALHIATFTSLAFVTDPLLLASCWWATADWDIQNRRYAFWAQFIYMFAFTKVVKLMGLFLRNPSDVIFLPVSILFGYFHGLVKLYALVTLNMVRCTVVSITIISLTRLNTDVLGQPSRRRHQR